MTTKTKRNRAPRVPRPNQRLVTIQQLTIEYGVPYTSIRDLILRGQLPSVRFGDTKRYWVRRSDFDALVAQSVEVAK